MGFRPALWPGGGPGKESLGTARGRVVGEQRVVEAGGGGGVGRAVDDGEGEGLEPCGAAFGMPGEDNVVGPWMEVGLHGHDAPRHLGREPAALQEEDRRPPAFSCRKSGYIKALVSFIGGADVFGLNLFLSGHGRFARLWREVASSYIGLASRLLMLWRHS